LTQGGFIFWLVGAVAAFMTATYMFRAVFMTFHGKSRVDHETAHHLHESPGLVTIPLIVLAVLSTIGGFIGFPVIEGWNQFNAFLSPVFAIPAKVAEAGHHSAGFEIGMMVVSIVIAVLGILAAYRMYIKNPGLPDQLAERYQAPYQMIAHKYWVDEIYDFVFVGPLVRSSVFLWRIFDDILVDGTVNGVAAVVRGGSEVFKRLQTGNVQSYALSILLGVVLIIGYFIFNIK
jgi:NADH-quinone oxidoreductase subunit L